MRVRRAVLADAGSIAEVHVLGWQVGYRGLLPQAVLDELRPAQRLPRWTETLRRASWPGRGTLVAEDGGRLIGFADFRPTADPDQDPSAVGEVASFYVRADQQGRGVGRRLMSGTLDSLTDAGFARATLWVLGSNAPALAFYARLGWTSDGSTRSDVVGGCEVTDLRLVRTLV